MHKPVASRTPAWPDRTPMPRAAGLLPVLLLALLPGGHSRAAVVTLKNGMQLEGILGKLAGVAENPLNPPKGEVDVRLVVLIDDGLRRTFVSYYQVQDLRESEPMGLERIRVQQAIRDRGRRIASVGAIIRITPFDDWGRRIFSMIGPRGEREDVLQGITEITPEWTKVEGLLQGPNSYVWDMRIATSSIPRQTLSAVLMHAIDRKNADHRLTIVRLYTQAERYPDARAELEAVLRDFPELDELKKAVKALRESSALRLIKEIELRQNAGQHALAFWMLSNFPDDGVAGETLLRVRQILAEYAEKEKTAKRVLDLLKAHAGELENADLRKRIGPIYDEIAAGLNINTLGRMADYLRLADDEDLDAEQKVSLAASGWLLGSGSGIENLAVSLSLLDVRDLVRQYLRESQAANRQTILEEIESLEGGTPNYLAKLVAQMTPPVVTEKGEGEIPGLYTLAAPGITGLPDVIYHVQLPPEYDPFRRYPAVVTLNGLGSTPMKQIDWWAGAYSEKQKMRLGQATRHGYIVIAPIWMNKHQRKYEYSAREHAAVLYSLRDAFRRFSIDTDRVFLSGHSIGGDAVWDVGLAHPDLWAGVVPITAVADRFVSRYADNARYVSFYFVAGEFDGGKMAHNARDLDRYMQKAHCDTIVVEYRGRGHENFADEIQRIFQWMNLHERDFFPKEFECSSMRSWDNFFWWAEVGGFPSRSVVSPLKWPPPSGTRPVVIHGAAHANNRITLRTGASRAVVWLTPELVDFDERLGITYNGKYQAVAVRPEARVLLEDVRTRGDRLHPFWTKVELQTGR